MKLYREVFSAVAIILMVTSPSYSKDESVENSIACVSTKIAELNKAEAGRVQLQVLTPLMLGEECSRQYDWTVRKATASSLYASAQLLLETSAQGWAETGYAEDLPLRVKKRITLPQLTETVLQPDATLFKKILADEFAVTGSKLNADSTIDELTKDESYALGRKLGRVLMGLFFQEELPKFFDDPDYQSPELFALFEAIARQHSDLIVRLK